MSDQLTALELGELLEEQGATAGAETGVVVEICEGPHVGERLEVAGCYLLGGRLVLEAYPLDE